MNPIREPALVLGLVAAASLIGSCTTKRSQQETPAVRFPPLGGAPSGPVDSCAEGVPLRGVCMCDGSVYSSGFCCEGRFGFSRCPTKAYYVRPEGGGARDGSNWANALAGVPQRLERDAVYWLAAGDYGRYHFHEGSSRDAGTRLRKATALVHGSDEGWSASYGSGPAVFGPVRVSGEHYAIDGGEPNGIKIVGRMGTNAAVQIEGSYIVLHNVEIDGGVERDGMRQTAGSCSGAEVDADHVVFDRCELHNIADDGLSIRGKNIRVLRSEIHNLHGCGTDGSCDGPCYNGHSDGLEISNTTGLEIVGNLVYDVRSTAAVFLGNWDDTRVSNLVVYNNVFYTPATGITVYLHHLKHARIHNNVIWGRTQGNRFGGLAIGRDVTDLEMFNNIILNINYSHTGGAQDPAQHRLDHNLFGVVNSSEYEMASGDRVGDPGFAGIPMSSDESEHKGGDLELEDFKSASEQVFDTGIAPRGMPAYDISGVLRPQGGAWDRGPFEAQR